MTSGFACDEAGQIYEGGRMVAQVALSVPPLDRAALAERIVTALRALDVGTLEAVAALHDAEAQRHFQLRDPGTANAHRSWARRIRAMAGA